VKIILPEKSVFCVNGLLKENEENQNQPVDLGLVLLELV